MSAVAAELWPDEALPRGSVVNGFGIEAVLGRGGFGITYLVRDLLGQRFALKECFPEQFARRQGTRVVPREAGDAEVCADCHRRFVDEARVLVRLGALHAGESPIVRMLTILEANDTAYTLMEYLPGESLEAWLRARPQGLPAPELEALLGGLLHGLQLVHGAGLAHRDLKPGNILLRAGGQPVLIDFGSARFVQREGDDSFTQIYSAGYAPIEQMLGTAQGAFSDLYAVGAVAYRAMGGTPARALARHNAVLAGLPDPLRPARVFGAGRYPPALLAMVDAALALRPEGRPASAKAMLALLGGSDATTVQIAPPQAAAPQRRRGRLWPMLAGSTAVAAAALLVWSAPWERGAAVNGVGRPQNAMLEIAGPPTVRPAPSQAPRTDALVPDPPPAPPTDPAPPPGRESDPPLFGDMALREPPQSGPPVPSVPQPMPAAGMDGGPAADLPLPAVPAAPPPVAVRPAPVLRPGPPPVGANAVLGFTLADTRPPRTVIGGVPYDPDGTQVRGAVVAAVAPGRWAEVAGLRPGDVVATLAGEPVRDAPELWDRLDVLRRRGEFRAEFRVQGANGDRTLAVPLFPGSELADLGLRAARVDSDSIPHFGLRVRRAGAVVTDIRPGGWAAAAGLMVGDILAGVAGVGRDPRDALTGAWNFVTVEELRWRLDMLRERGVATAALDVIDQQGTERIASFDLAVRRQVAPTPAVLGGPPPRPTGASSQGTAVAPNVAPRPSGSISRCRVIIQRAQIGEPLSDADRTLLRSDCRG